MMHIIAIGIAGIVAYIWLTRGFLSSLLNMICVIAAGAIAFAFWEPLANIILDNAPQRGFLSFITDTAWGISLATLFAVSLALLRAGTDSIIKANASPDDLPNMLGGGFCGLVSGTIVSGILIISIGFLHLPPNLWGYQPIDWTNSGSLHKSSSLIFPTDKLTAKFYSQLSKTVFATNEPLAKYYPDLEIVPVSLKMTYGDVRLGEATTSMRTQDGKVLSHYTVGLDQGLPARDLLNDGFDSTQNAVDINEEPYPTGSHIEGFIIRFGSGAKEKSGQIIITSAQIRLIAESSEGKAKTLFPIACVSLDNAEADDYARFLFDTSALAIPSRGSQQDVDMGFEFVIPPDFTPVALYVKGARLDFEPAMRNSQDFSTPDDRTAAVNEGELIHSNKVDIDDLDSTGAANISNIDPRRNRRSGNQSGQFDGIVARNSLPFRITLQKGQERSLQVDDTNHIIDGQAAFTAEQLSLRVTEKALRVSLFGVTNDTVMVQVDVSPTSRSSLLGKSLDAAERVLAPALIDDQGRQYPAVGYVYRDRNKGDIRYTPSQPMRAMSEIPTALTRSRDDQELMLLFRVTQGVRIVKFVIGKKVVSEYEGGLLLNRSQK